VKRDWRGRTVGIEPFLEYLRTREEPAWKIGAQPLRSDDVYWVEREYLGYNIFAYRDRWYAVAGSSFHPSRAGAGGYRDLVQAESMAHLQAEIRLRGPARPLWAPRLYRLPVRAWRKSRRLLASLWQEKTPW